MAYGIKYKCSFDSMKGLNYKVYILQKDYNSAVYDLRMGGTPVQINYTSNSENKFEIIRGSECILNFYSEYDGQFTEIMTADKNQFMVQVMLDDVLHWQGYVIQDNYTEPFTSAPYMVSLRATDGLGDLKFFDYAKENGTVYLNDMTFSDVILNCLGLLKNGTKLITSNDVFETRMDRLNASLEAFNMVTVNPFIFLENELNAKKCDEVLKMVLELFQCYIYYKKGAYYIERVNYKLSNTLTRRTYNIDFNDAQSIANVVTTENIRGQISKTGNLTFINADHSSTYTPAYNKVETNSDVIDSKNLFINNYFRFWNDTTGFPFNCVKSGTLDIEKKEYPKSGAALQINTKLSDDNAISLSTNCLKIVKNSFQGVVTSADKLNIKMASVGNVRFMVKATTPTKNYYLKSSGYTENNEVKYEAWFTETPSFCKVKEIGGSRTDNPEGSFSVTDMSATIPDSVGSLDISFLPTYIDQDSRSVCIIREFTPTVAVGNEARNTGENYSITSNKVVRETYNDYSPVIGEFGTIGSFNQLLLITPTGKSVTNTWYREGRTESKALFEIGVRSILNQYRDSHRLFSGSFYGEFDYGKVYTIETLTGLHMSYKCNSDLKFDTHNVSFFELLNDADDSSDTYKRYVIYKDGDYSTNSNFNFTDGYRPRPNIGGGGRNGRG